MIPPSSCRIIMIFTIYICRSRCSGVEAIDSSGACRDSTRAHFFLRFTVFRTDPEALRNSDPSGPFTLGRGRVSQLHFVDLVGTSNIDDREFNALVEEDREARREVFLQHQALSKVKYSVSYTISP